jgi:hypothetical protein
MRRSRLTEAFCAHTLPASFASKKNFILRGEIVQRLRIMYVLLLVLALVAPPAAAQSKQQAKAPAAKKGAPAAAPAPEPPPPPDAVDYDALFKIKQEALQRSQVMDLMSYLTDVHGPRLTNSPQIRAAGEWAVMKLADWGMVNAKLEPWTQPFGRGWSNERTYFHVVSPNPFPVIAYSPAWTPGTDGMRTCEVVYAPINREADLENWKGKLKGKCVLTSPMRAVPARWRADGQRFTDEQLEELARQPMFTGGPGRPPDPQQLAEQLSKEQLAQLVTQLQTQLQNPAWPQRNQRIQQLLAAEGAIWIQPGRGDGGTVFVQSGGGRQPNAPPVPATLVIAIEHYGRIMRMLARKVELRAEVNIQNKFYDQDQTMFNVVAEIPGTDKGDEVVMLGAHFDSWHTGTGATDNAAGSAVMMEVMRILKASGLTLRRTVRLGLWAGEEQGLLGSRDYMRAHFAEPTTDTPPKWNIKPEHAKLAGYFNIDNGTGKIRGVYLQSNEAVAPIFRTWMEPFKNMGMTHLVIRNTGGTDHLAFDGVGLPGFQFIQDEIEYDTRTHHSNMDVYERIQENDLKQIATIVASFVYHTANRQQMLPRKPMPNPPQPPRPPGAAPGGPPAPQRP